jgi:hypothetical protein
MAAVDKLLRRFLPHSGPRFFHATLRAKKVARKMARNVARIGLRAILFGAEFQALHPGNVVRFGIRPLEFAAWQTSQRAD